MKPNSHISLFMSNAFQKAKNVLTVLAVRETKLPIMYKHIFFIRISTKMPFCLCVSTYNRANKKNMKFY